MFILFEVTKMFLVIVLVNCNDPDTQYSRRFITAKYIVCDSQAFGHQLIAPQEHLKKATVILNPAACNGYDYTHDPHWAIDNCPFFYYVSLFVLS